MKLDAKAVAKAAGKGADSGGLGQIEGIIKGINTIFENYWRLQGKAPPVQAVAGADTQPKLGFGEAREKKKAEMAAGEKGGTMPDNTEFKDLLAGLIKAARTMEAMGNGETPIGQAILELPVSVSQTREFLERLFQSKYPGGE